MAEPVRLVVWDLDETFWTGTLSEGGMTYNSANHDIVIELAKRGIVSTICSKNDHETVKAILVEKGIWDYFIFPSINWNPKGPRLKALIDDVQLRPETVLLIDDNVLNLKEAEHFVPGIQTADEKIIPGILNSPAFKGKNDTELSRLKQYQLLQTRKADESVAEDNTEFLRSCNIRVTIEHDVESHIDRAIELINRTNQLNFTKKRLSEDIEEARKRLRKSLARLNIQAGLVRVTDRYGDYGYCGFYLARTRRGKSSLVHFCFSCRILNMGVENWLYQRMGSPEIDVQGEVLTTLSSDTTIDWIAVDEPSQSGTEAKKAPAIPRVVIRGACAVSPLVHYFQMDAQEVIGEFNIVRDGMHQIRLDHSLMLRYAIDGVSSAQMEIFENLGFDQSDLETAFTDRRHEPAIRVLSSWVDLQEIVYRHKATGSLVPYKVKIDGAEIDPLVSPREDETAFAALPERVQRALKYLRGNFEFVGTMPEADAEKTLDVILGAVPKGSPAFVISIPENGKRGTRASAVQRNEQIARAAARNPDIVSIAISEFADEDEKMSRGHFHRNVYYRLYQAICARYEAQGTVEEKKVPAEVG